MLIMVHLHTVIWLIFALVIISVRLARTKEGFQSKKTRILLWRFAIICVAFAIAIIDSKDSLDVFFEIFDKLKFKGYNYAVTSSSYFGIGITCYAYSDACSVILHIISLALLVLSLLQAPIKKATNTHHFTTNGSNIG